MFHFIKIYGCKKYLCNNVHFYKNVKCDSAKEQMLNALKLRVRT